QLESLLGDQLLDDLFAVIALLRVLGEKYVAGSKLARLRKLGPQVGADHLGEEFVRERRENARSIPRVGIAAAGPPVVHASQDLSGVDEYLVAADPFDVGHEAYSARVVLELRVVQALRLGQVQ